MPGQNNMPGMGGGSTAAEQKVDLGHAFGRLARFCRPYLPTVAAASALALAGAIPFGTGKLGQISDLITAGIGGQMNMGAIRSIGFSSWSSTPWASC